MAAVVWGGVEVPTVAEGGAEAAGRQSGVTAEVGGGSEMPAVAKGSAEAAG